MYANHTHEQSSWSWLTRGFMCPLSARRVDDVRAKYLSNLFDEKLEYVASTTGPYFV